VVLALPTLEKIRVACKLTASPVYEENSQDFGESPIGMEWKMYSHLQQEPCPPRADGVGCRHDLLLRAIAAQEGVQCTRPDGSSYHTNLLVLEEAAASLEALLLQGPLRESHALVMFDSLLAAVSTLHRHQISHRDLKPCQVLFSKEGKMKLADLDGACFFRDLRWSAATLDAITEVSDDAWKVDMLSDGTPGWMAPEVAAWHNWTWGEPRPPYYSDPTATDVWGCGQILLCMLLGVDGRGEAPSRESVKDPGLSLKARQLLDGLLEVDPVRRANLSSMRQLLTQYWADLGRPSDSEVVAEIVSRLRRPVGTKINASGDEENDGWMIVKAPETSWDV